MSRYIPTQGVAAQGEVHSTVAQVLAHHWRLFANSSPCLLRQLGQSCEHESVKEGPNNIKRIRGHKLAPLVTGSFNHDVGTWSDTISENMRNERIGTAA